MSFRGWKQMSERIRKERKEQRMQTRKALKGVWLRKRTLLLFLAPLGVLLLEIAKRNAFFAEEVFAKRIYRVLSVCISVLTGWLPFSLAEWIVILAPVLLLLLLFLFFRHIHRARGGANEVFAACMNGIVNLACAVSVFFFIYAVGCGVNYYRYPVAGYLGLEVQESAEEELKGLFTELAKTAALLREELASEDENGVYVLPMTEAELGRLAAEAYESFAEEYDIFAGHYPKPKQVMLSRLMSYTQITGIYTCWTMEANVNIDISPYSIASTMCHELSHLRGFMREDEANYLSYRVCMASESKDVQYSGVMHALIHTGNALYRKNPEAYYEIAGLYYSAGMRRDLAANSEYWKQFEHTKVAQTSEKINDTYLKANNQTDGTQSYGRVVDLLLAEYRQRK